MFPRHPIPAGLFLLSAFSLSGASISWGPPTDTASKADLVEGQRVVLAISAGNGATVSQGGASGLSTYEFQGVDYSDLFFSPSAGSRVTSGVGGSSSTGDAAFDAVIGSFADAEVGIVEGTQAILNLTSGVEYQIQVFYCDQRSGFTNRTMTYGDGVSPTPSSVTLSANGSGWGQYAIGTFVAASSGQILTHTANAFGNVHFNAIVIVEAGEAIPDLPQPLLFGDAESDTPGFSVFFTFPSAVTGFDADDLFVGNGMVRSVSGSGRYWEAAIEALSPGEVTIQVQEGAATTTEMPGIATAASAVKTVVCTADFGETWTIESAADWNQYTRVATNLAMEDGTVGPTAALGEFSSETKVFEKRKRALYLEIQQTPTWDYWIPVANIGPSSGASDAPILLPVANDDYYFLARGSTGGYHAWHSTDMVNWTNHGPITQSADRWVTTAEYKDGEYFIYYDNPNDEDPHLYIDDNLKDGIIGTKMGMVFFDPSHGSDCAVLRSNSDGLFHMFYEDWDPINARENSWDSPLAGHTTSPDGINGFEPHAHVFPIDDRTNPTGTFGTYFHPTTRRNYTYEIHTPAQDAYGDYTAIKIGSQYYLFADYDQHDGGIQVGRFTSDSVYREFDLVGSLGNGHPDPSVGFAEGQFYLLTQQSTDYISPGPWVDGVSARAGVDTDGDGAMDQWTSWQAVQETYDHLAGYARVVDVTPARIDLSGLPAGYGFQVEFRLDDTAVPAVAPVVDAVLLQFAPTEFRGWSNDRSIPEIPGGDHNNNGLPNLVEFALGDEALPSVQSNGRVVVPVSAGAVLDDYEVLLRFSSDLQNWTTATEETNFFRLIETNNLSEGHREQVYELSSPRPERLFWQIVVQ